MQREFDDATFLVGNQDRLLATESVPALPIFSEAVIYFLSCLSEELLHNSEAKKYGDVIAYAFWIRRKALEKVRDEYDAVSNRIGRGMSFQITPSNIPVQFAVSMTYSLIGGNVSVVRLSNKGFSQVDIICQAINKILDTRCGDIKPYVLVLRCGHEDETAKWLSENCDIRMIWGGDATVNQIRKLSIQPRCVELCFSDRYSIAVIDSDEYLKTDSQVLAADFYNDTYYSDQNACSSTRLIVWVGESVEKAKTVFWKAIEREVEDKYNLSEISGSDKLLKTAVCAVNHPGIKEIRTNNAIVRVELPELFFDVMDYKGNSGYFFEYETNDLTKIIPILGKRCQTVSFWGETIGNDLRRMVFDQGVRGVDRIVPLGHTMDLSMIWDGYDLPLALSRIISNL